MFAVRASRARRSGRTVAARAMRLVVCLVAVVILGGCQTQLRVGVTVHDDGSGTVTVLVILDAQAARGVGELSKFIDVDDLKREGWTIIGPGPAREVIHQQGSSGVGAATPGSVAIAATHSFADVTEANRILASLNGPDGPFKNVRLERSSSLFSTRLGIKGTVDLSRGLDAFGDPDLTRALGASISQVVARSGGPVPEGANLVASIEVEPVHGQSWSGQRGNASHDDHTVSAQTMLGGPVQSIDVASTRRRTLRVLLACAVGAFVVVILLALATAPKRRRNRSARRPVRR